MFKKKDFHELGPLGRVTHRGVIFVCVSLEMCVCMCHCIANHPLRWRPLVEERIPNIGLGWHKGLERPHLIGLVVAEFIYTRTITKSSVKVLDASKMIITKDYAPLGALSISSSKGQPWCFIPIERIGCLWYSNVTKGKYYLIFYKHLRNKKVSALNF